MRHLSSHPKQILRVRSLSLPDLRIYFDLPSGEVSRGKSEKSNGSRQGRAATRVLAAIQLGLASLPKHMPEKQRLDFPLRFQTVCLVKTVAFVFGPEIPGFVA